MKKFLKRTIVNWTDINTNMILYVKVFYTNEQNNIVEIKTNVLSCSNTYLFLRINQNKKLDIKYPQKIQIKIVTYETMYQTETMLKEILYHTDWTCISVEKPAELERVQDREYYRVNASNKTATIYCTNSFGNINEFNVTIFDMSIKSIKAHNLLCNNKTVSHFDFNTVKNIRVKLHIDTMREITIPVKFLNYRKQDGIDTYIFSFRQLSEREEMLLSKILTDIQRIQLHKNTKK